MRPIIFRQMFEHLSSTYTYILACSATREAIIIDPVIETVIRDSGVIKDLHLNLKLAANTHVHADHVTGSGELRKLFPQCKTVISRAAKVNSNILVTQGDILKFGEENLEVRSTPGHTDGCISLVSHKHKMVFTGDALLIRGCGRTDFQQGNSNVLYESVHSQILSLPKDYLLYPGHDYKGLTCTTVEEELENNPRLRKSKPEFVDIMKNLNLPYPRQIDKSLPANLVCGVFELMDEKTKQMVQDAFKMDQGQRH